MVAVYFMLRRVPLCNFIIVVLVRLFTPSRPPQGGSPTQQKKRQNKVSPFGGLALGPPSAPGISQAFILAFFLLPTLTWFLLSPDGL